jgi:phosphate-selective porin OprO/OprP
MGRGGRTISVNREVPLVRSPAAGVLLALIMLMGAPRTAEGQQPANSQQPNGPQSAAPASPPLTLDDKIEAGDEELAEPVRRLVKWNEYEGTLVTFRFGGGLLYEYAAFSQDDASKRQVALLPEPKVRDSRILFKGGFKFDRPVTWSAGILYDVPTGAYLFRETGIMITVPELSGHVFVGRSKEGFSLNKVMVGYAGWTMERATISDATIPILADGIKWLGYAPKKHLIWNLGFYMDRFSEGHTFSTYDHQAVARVAWVPLMSETTKTVLHFGSSFRYGEPNDGQLQLRSRPEAFPASFFVDTGRFPAKSTTMIAPEAYYRPGAWLFGSEYFFQSVDAPESGDPFFHGGDAVVAWLPTGETRVYNTRGGFFNAISPARPVFQGGPGAWEIVARLSYIDLDSGPLRGGTFWRFTPMVNWHLSDNVRLELVYGYGSLDRFDLTGRTHFFQSRLQLVI